MNAKYFLDKGAFRANCAVRKVAMEGRGGGLVLLLDLGVVGAGRDQQGQQDDGEGEPGEGAGVAGSDG